MVWLLRLILLVLAVASCFLGTSLFGFCHAVCDWLDERFGLQVLTLYPLIPFLLGLAAVTALFQMFQTQGEVHMGPFLGFLACVILTVMYLVTSWIELGSLTAWSILYCAGLIFAGAVYFMALMRTFRRQ